MAKKNHLITSRVVHETKIKCVKAGIIYCCELNFELPDNCSISKDKRKVIFSSW